MREVVAPAMENEKVEYMPVWFKITMAVCTLLSFTLLGYLTGFLVAYNNLSS